MTAVTLPARQHPAPYPRYILNRLALYLSAERRALQRSLRILDPFAGVGRVHDLPARLGVTTGVELEPEWAAARASTRVGDATKLPATWSRRFDAVVTSPCYGNRLADSHDAQDSCGGCGGTGTTWDPSGCPDAPMFCPSCGVDCACGDQVRALRGHVAVCVACSTRRCKRCGGSGLSRRHTYRHSLGRLPTDGSAAVMQWGEPYRRLHAAAWAEAHRVLRPRGLILVNVKNHIRDDSEQQVVEWHAQTLRRGGFDVLDIATVPAPGIRHGANRDARTAAERIIVGRSK